MDLSKCFLGKTDYYYEKIEILTEDEFFYSYPEFLQQCYFKNINTTDFLGNKEALPGGGVPGRLSEF